MIALTQMQREKIQLLDKLFNSLDLEQLKEITEREQIVSKLKGDPAGIGIIERIVHEHDIAHTDIMRLQGDLQMLRSDVQMLVRLTLKPFEYSSAGDASALKSKYAIY